MTAWMNIASAWLVLAGAGQLCLALASLAIPRLLDWPQQLTTLRPLTRQVFWVYAFYIWSSHLAFGLLSLLAPAALLDGSLLAGCVCTFIAAWWGIRLLIQFACLSRDDAPQGTLFRLGEAALVASFVAFAGVYLWAATFNLSRLLR